MARINVLKGSAPHRDRAGAALTSRGRGAGLALLIGGTALLAATFARPVAAAGRWLIEPGGLEDGPFAGDREGAEAGEEPAPPCALPDWHPRVDCGAVDGLSARDLELPPGHPPIGGLPRGRTGEPRTLPAPAFPSAGPRGDRPLWI